jgi:hypothetical protein
MKCAIHAVFIAKENILFLEEWIDYHMQLGFTHFYLYDNSKVQAKSKLDGPKKHMVAGKINRYGINYDSLINLKERDVKMIMKKIKEKYPVIFIEWSPKDKDGLVIYGQVAAHNDCLERLKKTDIKWCASIDIDEFIVPKTETITEYLADLDKNIFCVKMGQLLFESRFNNIRKLITTVTKTAKTILPREHSNKYIYDIQKTDSLEVHTALGEGKTTYPELDEIHFNHYKIDFKNNRMKDLKDHKVKVVGLQTSNEMDSYKIVKNPVQPNAARIVKKHSKNYILRQFNKTRKNKKLNRNKTLKSRDQ